MAVALGLPAGTGADACAAVVYPLLASRFRTAAIDYLKQPDTLAQRLLCRHRCGRQRPRAPLQNLRRHRAWHACHPSERARFRGASR
jgi:hypothetical protein